ncbi:hypothetical protein AB0F18_35190 [Streptomyces sp. NPDC029216]|uniref:hypothetical protein n=1 Tax=Streptomyces sp. NPDC029216 TaxID=3154701 RepID=UPI0033DED470
MNTAEIMDYRIEHLRERLAHEDAAELGVRIEAHGARAVLSGRVTDDEARAAVLRIAGEALDGLDWYEDLTVCRPQAPSPGQTEDVS